MCGGYSAPAPPVGKLSIDMSVSIHPFHSKYGDKLFSWKDILLPLSLT